MPISVPVPKEFAQKYDAKTPSTYGEEAAVYTGPYMVKSDAEGKATGYVAGKTIDLVRNPDYAPVDDFRPAYLDEIEFQAGNEDTAVATRRILSGREPRRRRHRAARRGSSRRCSRPTSRSSRRCRAVAGA